MTFTSDAQLYSGKELAAMKKDRGDWLAGLTPFAPGTTKTYIANDIPSTRGAYMFSGLDQKIGIVLAAQIHEFGVAMSANFGQRDPPDKYLHPENKRLFDPDSGMALEDCVKNKLK
jgi:hypothetical protein